MGGDLAARVLVHMYVWVYGLVAATLPPLCYCTHTHDSLPPPPNHDQVLISAAEAAEMIIRVDDIIKVRCLAFPASPGSVAVCVLRWIGYIYVYILTYLVCANSHHHSRPPGSVAPTRGTANGGGEGEQG